MGCQSRITVRNPKAAHLAGKQILVPCGKCPSCLKRRVDSWAFRLMQEYKRSSMAHFVTLTYSNTFVPRTKNNYLTLERKDFTNFMKRLRKQTGIKGIKYYAAGEYGGQTKRPHYHAIIFNVPYRDYYENAWKVPYTDGLPFGEVHVGQVTQESCAYVAKYLDKRQKIGSHPRDDRKKEFSAMSQGIGDNWVTDEIKKFHKADPANRMCIILPGGQKIAMPRRYRDMIFDEEEKEKQLEEILRVAKEKKEEMDKRALDQGLDPVKYKQEQDLHRIKKFNNMSNKRNKL
jgi:heterodisulfide reductase subunit B